MPILPCEVTREMRYAVWKDQYLFVGATHEQAHELATTRVEDERQRAQDEQNYRAMLAAAPTPPVSAAPPWHRRRPAMPDIGWKWVTPVCLLLASTGNLVGAYTVHNALKANNTFMEAQLVMYRTTAHTTASACQIIDELWRDKGHD
ncbi:hypothetical protein GCM10007301_15010 [Azorhizobium oxalatiphilum]|uniref:Uncharacterized protein n=1 Tax=Azorhizobium oxalatiphilum TaxID=980631 RepID=A0A917BU40_9HYPH|nr:hypothetical protein [Azorhizobium oxalatiphilum]GGF56373.1 hypothetical protein GCM10007301_15010 [Azorhizobium oxalatiphilum]